MPTHRTSWQRQTSRAGKLLRLGTLLAACSFVVASSHAAPATASTAPELSEALSTELGVIRPQMEGENPNYPELIKKFDSLIISLRLSGYDLAYVNQLKANMYIRLGEPLKAIKPVEDSLVGDFFPPEATSGMTLALAQLYMQDAGSTSDEKHRQLRLAQTRTRLEQWFATNKEPLLGAPAMEAYSDAVMLYANALYYLKAFKLSYEQSKKLVHLSIEPKDQSWIVLFAAQQEAGDNAAAAETFELFIRKFPDKKDYWLQLAQAYLNSDQSLRAILTYQRAQSHGFMSAPSDYMNMFSLYYRIEEFSRGAELLEGWIRSGKVEDNEDNWELVSVCYQNLRRDDRVRTILDGARKRFKIGNLDYQLAQYLWYDGKYKEGLEAAELAWKKGGLKKPGRVALFLSTANYEQRDFPRAKMFFELASKTHDVEKSELDRVGSIINQTPDTPPPTTAGTPKSGT